MSTPDKEPIPFETLSGFEKPTRCDVYLSCKGSLFQSEPEKDVILGCRRGDPNIYYQDGTISGRYLLTKPMESLSISELLEFFPDGIRYIVNKNTFIKIWLLAQETQL